MVGRSSRHPSRQLSHMGFTELRDGVADGDVETETKMERDIARRRKIKERQQVRLEVITCREPHYCDKAAVMCTG